MAVQQARANDNFTPRGVQNIILHHIYMFTFNISPHELPYIHNSKNWKILVKMFLGVFLVFSSFWPQSFKNANFSNFEYVSMVSYMKIVCINSAQLYMFSIHVELPLLYLKMRNFGTWPLLFDFQHTQNRVFWAIFRCFKNYPKMTLNQSLSSYDITKSIIQTY